MYLLIVIIYLSLLLELTILAFHYKEISHSMLRPFKYGMYSNVSKLVHDPKYFLFFLHQQCDN